MKKRSHFLFVDLIEDKIKIRGIFIAISLLFYIYLTWNIFIGFNEIDLTPSVIEWYLDFPNIVAIGQKFSDIRSPQIKIINSQGEALVGVKVSLIVVQIVTDTSK